MWLYGMLYTSGKEKGPVMPLSTLMGFFCQWVVQLAQWIQDISLFSIQFSDDLTQFEGSFFFLSAWVYGFSFVYILFFLAELLKMGFSLIINPDSWSSASLCCYICVEPHVLTVNQMEKEWHPWWILRGEIGTRL